MTPCRFLIYAQPALQIKLLRLLLAGPLDCSLHCLFDLPLHFAGYLGGTSGKLGLPSLSISGNIIKEQFHLGYFEDLSLNDLVRQLPNAWIANARLPRVIYGN